MASFLLQLAGNKTFITTLLAWIIAQGLKVAIGVVREKRFNFRWFVGTGGMPSSHSAGACALATSVGITHGAGNTLFAVCLLFAFVAMFDAQFARRAIGRQAETLNRIMEDLYFKKGVKEERLRELIGHTPIEVFVGAALGIIVAVVYHAVTT